MGETTKMRKTAFPPWEKQQKCEKLCFRHGARTIWRVFSSMFLCLYVKKENSIFIQKVLYSYSFVSAEETLSCICIECIDIQCFVYMSFLSKNCKCRCISLPISYFFCNFAADNQRHNACVSNYVLLILTELRYADNFFSYSAIAIIRMLFF